MSTTKLDNQELVDLQPATGLWKMYDPQQARYHFQAANQAEAARWQEETRAALDQTVGFQDWSPVPFEAQSLEIVDKGNYTREKLLIRTSANTLMPLYILLPKDAPGPLPVAVAFHGHGYGVKDIVGLWEDGEERSSPTVVHQDFAVALCRRGMAVAAPEISGFGERQSDFSHLNTTIGQGVPNTCVHMAMLAFHLGGSVVGLRAWDGKRLIDYLETRPEMDTSRLGAMGISGGGMHTLFSTCLDTRIKACVISGYYSSFQESILAMHHCPCNFVPGLHQFGEMVDLVGLIAPRPLLVESGSYDPIFPRAAVEKAVAGAKSVYAVFDAQDKVETDYFEGRHQISGKRAYDFLYEQLTAL